MPSSRVSTPSNKLPPSSKASTPSNKSPKIPTSANKPTDSAKSGKGPAVRKGNKVGTSNKKESEAKSSSGGLSRAQKAEEKHRRRVTLAQGGKGRGIADSNTMKNSEHRLHRRSSISRAQSLAYIAKTRTARSSTQGFSNVEGDEVGSLTFLN